MSKELDVKAPLTNEQLLEAVLIQLARIEGRLNKLDDAIVRIDDAAERFEDVLEVVESERRIDLHRYSDE